MTSRGARGGSRACRTVPGIDDPPVSGKRIAVVGSGAVGCFYGAKLAQAGEDVSFLMRRDLEAVRRDGLRIESIDGDFVLPEVKALGSTAEIGPVDLVIIALKSTANAALLELLPPLLHDNTVLLTLQNGLGNEDFLRRHFPRQPIVGGLCFVCIYRDEPGRIRHIAEGRVEMGDFEEAGQAEQIAKRFAAAGIHCPVLPDLGLARWRKLVWNVPFNGLSIAAGRVDTQRILADPELTGRVRRLMDEVRLAAAAHGHEIPESFAEGNIRMTEGMGAYKPSSLIDFETGAEVEIDAIWGEPLRRAREKGVEVPELERLVREIRTACGK